ncbi:MAG: hypothetical protein SFY67_07520 [Candidatus Melainabacteria bacterium]|nr:hypothetical protein [Candidatus Melainabacteria bacterium]
MGTFDPFKSVYDDDIAADVAGTFLRLYDEGNAPEKIEKLVRKECKKELADEDSGVFARLGLMEGLRELCLDTAKVEAEICKLLPKTELDDDLRKEFLKVLNKLSKPKTRPRKRQPIANDAIFDCGDCVALKFPDKTWGAALVLGRDDDQLLNLIIPLKYKKAELPTQAVFEKRDFIGKESKNSDNFPHAWYSAQEFLPYLKKVFLLGYIELAEDDHYAPNNYGNWQNLWDYTSNWSDKKKYKRLGNVHTKISLVGFGTAYEKAFPRDKK